MDTPTPPAVALVGPWPSAATAAPADGLSAADALSALQTDPTGRASTATRLLSHAVARGAFGHAPGWLADQPAALALVAMPPIALEGE